MNALKDLTADARMGYDGNTNPYIYSSAAWYACQLGKYLHDTGRTAPMNVRMGRGYTVHANDMTFKHSDNTGWELIK